ncbi:MAG: hypothetical protein ACI4II_00700 [Acutalibacteraceae bacterium]
MENNYNGNAQQPMQPKDTQPVVTGKTVTIDAKALKRASASLILGLISVLTFWIPLVPNILAIISIVYSVKARKAIPKGLLGRGMAMTGRILAIWGFVFAIFIFLGYLQMLQIISFFLSPEFILTWCKAMG